MSTGAARFAPHALLLLMIAIWGGSYVVVKSALGSLEPFAIIALRFWIAVACITPFVLSGRARAQLRAVLVPGSVTGIALGVGYLLQTVGMRETSASMGGFLAGLIPLLVAVGGWLVFHARPGRIGTVGLALGFVGMALLIWPVDTPGTNDTALGIALQVGSSISYACHVLLISRLGRGRPALPFCFVQLVVVALMGTLAVGLDGGMATESIGAASWSAALILEIAYLGLLATGLGIAVQSIVQPRISPMHVALLFATQPMFAAICGWLFLGDVMTSLQLAGGATIVAGIVITSLDR